MTVRMIHSGGGKAANHVRMNTHSRISRTVIRSSGSIRSVTVTAEAAEPAEQVEHQQDDQHEAETATETRARILAAPAVVRVVAATATEQAAQDNDDEDQHQHVSEPLVVAECDRHAIGEGVERIVLVRVDPDAISDDLAEQMIPCRALVCDD